MKSLNEMDLDEWELLPGEGFLEINDDGGKKIYSRKYPQGSSTSVLQMNYFMCPPKPSPEFGYTRMPNQLLPLPVALDPTTLKPDVDDQERFPKDVAEIPLEMKIIPELPEKMKSGLSVVDQDPILQVFFKKMKETEFVDMKMDSPKSRMMPQIEGTGGFQFEEKGDDRKVDTEMAMEEEMELEGGGINVWKWSLNGIGAICSFGVAAAAFCIILFSHQKNKHPHKNQKLQFRIHSNDRRVIEQASKLNEVIAAVRGVPMSRAHITCGGYHDAAAAL